ncbi:Hsp20/alpha crystallin family protein [Defluviicoccus vanus]|uniref:Hsp20/alpha crystallin family protein n=1 Tax=Defluviicoccus vanus TaxID=111831 RepID=A0A7H1N1V6_9PROT|nr:Hsp20/alpha crystallin family protein [Defluviicoccus vanus]QNT69692.1 Hsp20/alpha crystallin family protein [Defluviicoccus vanus]
MLTIRGERKAAETGYSYSERTYGKFKRHITLSIPVVADSVSAGFADGVLTLTMPKQPAITLQD